MRKCSNGQPFQFRWEPGNGPCAEALARMAARCPEPRSPMGEAWFMGKRRMFTELQGADPAALDIELLQKVLGEITSGSWAFGPHEEWWEWYHHLLPHLIPRFHQVFLEPLGESLISAFIALHPSGIVRSPDTLITAVEPFRQDVLKTLGRVLMGPSQWVGNEPSPEALAQLESSAEHASYGWNPGSGSFAAASFYCWKYLQPEEIEAWVASALAIRSSYFRAQWLGWLVGAYPALTGVAATFADLHRHGSHLKWAHSHLLGRQWINEEAIPVPIVSEANRSAFASALQRHLREDLILEWIDGFSRVEGLEEALGHVPDQLIGQYFSRNRASLETG